MTDQFFLRPSSIFSFCFVFCSTLPVIKNRHKNEVALLIFVVHCIGLICLFVHSFDEMEANVMEESSCINCIINKNESNVCFLSVLNRS